MFGGFSSQQKSLPLEGAIGGYAWCSSRQQEMTLAQTPCAQEEVQAVMVIPFLSF